MHGTAAVTNHQATVVLVSSSLKKRKLALAEKAPLPVLIIRQMDRDIQSRFLLEWRCSAGNPTNTI